MISSLTSGHIVFDHEDLFSIYPMLWVCQNIHRELSWHIAPPLPYSFSHPWLEVCWTSKLHIVIRVKFKFVILISSFWFVDPVLVHMKLYSGMLEALKRSLVCQLFEPYRTCINERWSSRCFEGWCHDLVLGVYVGDPIRDHIGCVHSPPFHNWIQVSTILDGALQRNVNMFTRRCSTATVGISSWVTHWFWNCDGKTLIIISADDKLFAYMIWWMIAKEINSYFSN